MKLIKYFKYTSRNINLGKYPMGIVFLIMCIIVALSSNMLLRMQPEDIKYTVFDILSHISGVSGITGTLSLVFPIIPAFCYVIITLIDFDKSIYQIIRGESRAEIWNKQVFHIITIALFFSVIIVIGGYIYSGLLVGDFTNGWNSKESYIYTITGNQDSWIEIVKLFSTYKMIPIIFISTLLGLCSFGFIICTLKILLKNIYVYIVISIILFTDSILGSFSLILKQMTINASNWIDPSTIIINDIYLLLIIVISYLLGGKLISRKDFI